MWTADVIDIDQRKVVISLYDEHVALSFRRFLDLCQTSVEFCSFLTATFAGPDFDAFFWECPPLRTRTLDAEFECVLIDAAALRNAEAEIGPFAEHFHRARDDQSVIVFPNLNGDATLVVPAPRVTDQSCYAHLATFLRLGPEVQVRDFWQTVGLTAMEHVSDQPLWLSTSGTGVFWLHVRLDTRPKYYQHRPYTDSR